MAKRPHAQADATKAQVRKRIFLSGVGGRYLIHTGGLSGLPDAVTCSDFRAGNAIVRTLRRIAAKDWAGA